MITSLASILPAVTLRGAAFGLSIVCATVVGGCANDNMGSLFSTGALGDAAPAVTTAKATTDPVCVSLSSQIDALRKEGTVGRLEKAADGKSAVVNVQRASLAKQTQLNKLNADFIAKCGPNLPKASVTASLATPVAPVATAAAKPVVAAAKTVGAKALAAAPAASGVTVALPTAATVAPVVAAPQ